MRNSTRQGTHSSLWIVSGAGEPLAEAIQEESAECERMLADTGAVLFQGFGVRDATNFKDAAVHFCSTLYGDYGDLPKLRDIRDVYAATPYAPSERIGFHNEASHTLMWPSRQFFFVQQQADDGGEWELVDGRSVANQLSPHILEKFERLQLMYRRRFLPGLDQPWQEFLGVEDPSRVVEHCRNLGCVAEWEEGDILRIDRIAPAVLHLRNNGVRTWFNQIQLHHPRYLSERTRNSLEIVLGEGRAPREVSYGDGSVIEQEVLEQIDDALEGASIRVRGRDGDVLVVDNRIVAHARCPYSGQRRVLVVLGDPEDITSYSIGGDNG